MTIETVEPRTPSGSVRSHRWLGLLPRAGRNSAWGAGAAVSGAVALTLFGYPSISGHEPPSTEASEPNPNQASTARLSRPAEYRVDFRVAVTPPAGTEVLKVWLPLPQDDRVQRVRDRRLETFPRVVEPQIATEPKFGNRFAYFEFRSPEGAQLISHRFTATVRQADWSVDFANVRAPAAWPDSFAAYRRHDPRAEASEELREVSRWIRESAGDGSASQRLLSSMRWVDQNLTYDHVAASLQADPTHALVHGRGHCSDYHGLCSTLAREAGFPSRVVYGLQMFEKASPSHCKLELFLPPHGWVAFDLSETQKLIGKVSERLAGDESAKAAAVAAITERSQRGFRENSWLAVTRGTHYDLAPPAESGPVNVVRTIFAEADGVALPEPDPANPEQRTFAWMTMHRVESDGHSRPFSVTE